MLLTCAEFENLSKQIYFYINNDEKKQKKLDIKVLSNTITTKYPKLKDTEISSPVQIRFRPLENWSCPNLDANTKCSGIDWWSDYTGLKHHRYANFSKATFQNCYDALASLFVLELYVAALIMPQDHNSFDFDPRYVLSSNPCPYFSSEYYRDLIWPVPKKLPDFS